MEKREKENRRTGMPLILLFPLSPFHMLEEGSDWRANTRYSFFCIHWCTVQWEEEERKLY